MLYSLIGSDVMEGILATAQDTPPGCFVEVGVYQGGSAYFLTELARKQFREIYLYDTFTGLPYADACDSLPVGGFNDTSYEKVAAALPYAHVIQGIFPASAVRMPPVAFAHLDCDQYRSVKESCQYLESLMVPGGVIWFDDYGCLEGATKAVDELYGSRIVKSTTSKWMLRL